MRQFIFMFPLFTCKHPAPGFLIITCGSWKAQQLFSFASAVWSSIKTCILPPLDSDAFIIGVDNLASRCIDSNIYCFTNVRHPKNMTFTKGIASWMVHWHSQDNQGQLHHIAIHDASLVLDLPQALLSPQHRSNKKGITFHVLKVCSCSN